MYSHPSKKEQAMPRIEIVSALSGKETWLRLEIFYLFASDSFIDSLTVTTESTPTHTEDSHGNTGPVLVIHDVDIERARTIATRLLEKFVGASVEIDQLASITSDG